MTYVNPLDFQTILVNYLSGSWIIFIGLALIFIAFTAAKLRMNNMMFIIMFALFGIIMAFWIQWLYALVIILVSLGIYFIIAKLIKQ